MKSLLVLLTLLTIVAAGTVDAAPDYPALLAAQQQRDSAREAQQRERLAEARRRLSAVRSRVSKDDTRFRSLQAELEALGESRQQRLATLVSQRSAVTDLYTTARQSAGDLITILRNSPTGPPAPQLEQQLTDLAASSRALDLDALGGLWEDLHLTLSATATQSREELAVQTEPGTLVNQSVTRIGTVLAVSEDRLLVYDRLANLYRARPPGNRAQRQAAATLAQTGAGVVKVPFAVGQLTTQHPDPLTDSVRQSGPIGLLIGVLGAIGLIVLLVRAIRLNRLLAAEKCASPGSAGARLRRQHDSHQAERRESLSGWLNATVRHEARKAQWGHTLLSVIIGVAPLLGLLGTVTGMILTFHALRLYGSGDPVLMADGIAQALSTTMLGLAVAIPLLIGQRWLLAQANRHVRHLDALALWLTARSLNGPRSGAVDKGDPA